MEEQRLKLVLYPYVYALARAAFLTGRFPVGGRTHAGAQSIKVFFITPMARPAIVVGVLALMETLVILGPLIILRKNFNNWNIYVWFE